jgi:acyl-CoA synthetase (AMP-forming)/AMP-acid ligase II
VTCMLLGEDAIRKLGSVGKVIPTVAARVVDEEMNDVAVGEVGEIVYRATTLMSGYWSSPEATAEAFSRRLIPLRRPGPDGRRRICCVRRRTRSVDRASPAVRVGIVWVSSCTSRA